MVTAADSSGNGRDGTYIPNASLIVRRKAGLVAGDYSLLAADPDATNRTYLDLTAGGVNASTDFTVAGWIESPVAFAIADFVQIWHYDNAGGSAVSLNVDYTTGEVEFGFPSIPAQTWRTGTGALAADGLAHFIVITFDFFGSVATLYIDGSSVAWATTGTLLNADPTLTDFFVALTPSLEVVDEFVLWKATLTAGDISSLYSAGVAGIASWNTAVLGLSPYSYYHLNEGAPLGGWHIGRIAVGP